MSRSESIRRMMHSQPNLDANGIVRALRKQGITVTNQLVYNVRSNVPRNLLAPQKIQRVPEVLNTIRSIKGLAEQVGGLKELAKLCEAML